LRMNVAAKGRQTLRWLHSPPCAFIHVGYSDRGGSDWLRLNPPRPSNDQSVRHRNLLVEHDSAVLSVIDRHVDESNHTYGEVCNLIALEVDRCAAGDLENDA
jgi:hypothetical protein